MSDPGCSRYPCCPGPDAYCRLWHPGPGHPPPGTATLVLGQAMKLARHCPSSCHPHLSAPRLRLSPGAIRWCAAQPHGLCADCPGGHGAVGNVTNPSTHPARAGPGSKFLPRSAAAADTASPTGLLDLAMQLLASLTLCLGLWAGLSTAVIPGGGAVGDWCPAGCSGCPGGGGNQQGTSLAGRREGLGRGAGASQLCKGQWRLPLLFWGASASFPLCGEVPPCFCAEGVWGKCL